MVSRAPVPVGGAASKDALIDHVPDAIFACDASGRLTAANAPLAEITGHRRECLTGLALADVAAPRTSERIMALLAGATQRDVFDGELLGTDGRVTLVEIGARVSGRGSGRRVSVVAREVGDRASQIADLRRRALHDPLTGLPNRTLFGDRVDQAILVSRRNGTPFALLLVDLDRFKIVNDRYGHRAGDAVLAGIARRLAGILRESDTIARLGGDEFGVLLPLTDEMGAEKVARKVREALREPVVVDGIRMAVGGSVGIAIFPEDGERVDVLLQRADIAMYTAKRRRRGIARSPAPRRTPGPGPVPASYRAGRPPSSHDNLSRLRLLAGACGLAVLASVAVVTGDGQWTGPFHRPYWGASSSPWSVDDPPFIRLDARRGASSAADALGLRPAGSFSPVSLPASVMPLISAEPSTVHRIPVAADPAKAQPVGPRPGKGPAADGGAGNDGDGGTGDGSDGGGSDGGGSQQPAPTEGTKPGNGKGSGSGKAPPGHGGGATSPGKGAKADPPGQGGGGGGKADPPGHAGGSKDPGKGNAGGPGKGNAGGPGKGNAGGPGGGGSQGKGGGKP